MRPDSEVTLVRTLLPLAALLLASPAVAQEAAPMTAWEALEELPPRSAWELGLHMSFGRIAYWWEETPAWVGFGIRGGWGRVFSDSNRLGFGVAANLEGPVPLYYSASLEPQVTWDRVRGGLQLGASVGPSLMLHTILEHSGSKSVFAVSPMAAVRVGYSESWSRIGRRFFALLEPKIRWVDGRADYSVALVVGSGAGS